MKNIFQGVKWFIFIFIQCVIFDYWWWLFFKYLLVYFSSLKVVLKSLKVKSFDGIKKVFFVEIKIMLQQSFIFWAIRIIVPGETQDNAFFHFYVLWINTF